MSLLIFLASLVFIITLAKCIKAFRKSRARKGAGISLLVPFRPDNSSRQQTWEWLVEYWTEELPLAEIVMGHTDEIPFCKTGAANDAARKAHGDILVLLDADCLIKGKVIVKCAQKIRQARKEGRNLWYVPYRRFYRLTEAFSKQVIESDPRNPLHVPDPPPFTLIETISEKGSSHGHWFGALIQIFPREAYDLVGGMDERFASWGGEDCSFMYALDTLFGLHRTSNNSVFHLWHPSFGSKSTERYWEGGKPGKNNHLSTRYSEARFKPHRMWNLVLEDPDYRA